MLLAGSTRYPSISSNGERNSPHAAGLTLRFTIHNFDVRKGTQSEAFASVDFERAVGHRRGSGRLRGRANARLAGASGEAGRAEQRDRLCPAEAGDTRSRRTQHGTNQRRVTPSEATAGPQSSTKLGRRRLPPDNMDTLQASHATSSSFRLAPQSTAVASTRGNTAVRDDPLECSSATIHFSATI
ncbi:hypothetical protein TNCT_668461 [Trichonephila clavata]|uniref:Uncharacterized protein n=1 Tax=Trichonephila clavata TaxID=2740835 RepID=A0A8X6KY82_TRICU|nr:hypothetical protein TNCT_668461 [Trichonephila clavata]